MLGKEIPELMKMIQKEEAAQNVKEKSTPSIKGVWITILILTCTTFEIFSKKKNSKNSSFKIDEFGAEFRYRAKLTLGDYSFKVFP